jgi:cell division protein FtsZ
MVTINSKESLKIEVPREPVVEPAPKSTLEAIERPFGTAVIKVFGVGGGGSNAVSRMFKEKVSGVEYIAVNTDVQHLDRCEASRKIAIGGKLTRGLGAGGDPEKGRAAAEETKDQIAEIVRGADMVFVTAGMGGGTGTGAAPIVAEVARDAGALTVAVVTKPFSFEVSHRRKIAEDGMAKLKEHVDTLICIPNDRLLQIGKNKDNFTWEDAMRMADSVLLQGIQSIAEVVTSPGEINVDFADIKAVMTGAGMAWMAIGSGRGETRAVDAAHSAIKSPLLDMNIEGAKRVLFVISGGSDMSLKDVQEAAEVVQGMADQDAMVKFGTVKDVKMEDSLKMTLVAAGFPGQGESLGERETELKRLLKDALPDQGEDLDMPAFLRKQSYQQKAAPKKPGFFR